MWSSNVDQATLQHLLSVAAALGPWAYLATAKVIRTAETGQLPSASEERRIQDEYWKIVRAAK